MPTATPPPPLPHRILSDALAARGWVTSEGAKRLDCSPSYLTRVLRGEHVPSDAIRARIERVLAIDRSIWDPRSLDRDALIRLGWRPRRLAKKLVIKPSAMLTWWRGGNVPEVAEAVGALLARTGA